MWEERADAFYTMRHHGLGRRNKPFPTASDLHFPLADSFIERMRPAFFQQLYATDTLCQFISQKAQSEDLTSTATQWFDYKVKQSSNLESEILTAIDWMLMLGRSVIKIRWDVDKKRLAFDAIDPRQFIVPSNTIDLETCDRATHVRTFSKSAFLRSGEFDIDSKDEVVKRLLMPKDSKESGVGAYGQTADNREGITDEEPVVIIWECWQRDEAGEWGYSCMSPTFPDIEIKPWVKNPYKHKGLPFIDFPYEVKDKGWYSPRGLVEMVATYETELTNLLNQKHDALTLTNRPVFSNDGGTAINLNNFQFKPGQCLPRGVKPAPMPKVPFDFQEAIQAVREIAEGRVTVPDFGITRVSDTTQRRTATEVNAVSNMFQQSSDLRLRIFRMGLGRLYRMAWGLLLQYDKARLGFYYIDTFQEAPDAALHDQYSIIPNGSADGVNRTYLYQKAVSRYQMFANNPFVDQGELVKSVLEVDDPAIVRRLHKDPGMQANEAREDQAMELAVIHIGLPAMVGPGDDHQAHLQAILAYITQNLQSGQVQPGPNEMQLLQRHVMEHIQALQQADPKAAQAAVEAFQAVFEASQGEQQPQQAEVPQQ